VKKILVLGAKGMLGNMVHTYLLSKNDFEIVTTNFRWPSDEFKKFVINYSQGQGGDYIINCIGAIHQRTSNFDINTDLPIWLDDNIDLERTNCKVIHPGTDCEVDDDEYGTSKRIASEYILNKGCVTKIIKTSIVGLELGTKASLLEWFLNNEDNEINGYSECYWNGNTTLQWAIICHDMMSNWNDYDILTVPATECISKYELLNIMKEVFNKEININKNSEVKVNKCLTGNIMVPSIKEQLEDLKKYVQ